MFAKDTPLSDERAVETGQFSQSAPAQPLRTNTVGYFEPHQMAKLAHNGRLYVIADSLGSPDSGQVAAEYVIKRVLRNYYTTSTPDLKERLIETIQQANKDILARNRDRPHHRPMAVTVMTALIHDNKLLVANVGDSSVYIVWDKDIERLNTDKLTEEAKKDEKPPVLLIPEKTEAPPEKPREPVDDLPRLPAALGLEQEVKVETFSRRLFAGDVMVLCSGGLKGYVSDKEIAEAISMHAPNQAILRLINLAAERGNKGHLAISVTKILDTPVAAQSPMPMVMPSDPKWSDWEPSAKSATRPLSKPVPPTLPTAQLSAKPSSKPVKPVEIPLNRSRRPGRGCILATLLLLILCALPVLIWRYAIPPNLLAAIPVIGEADAAVRAWLNSPEPELAETTVPGAEEMEQNSASVQEEATLDTPAPDSPAAGPEATLAAGSNSPLPTPTPGLVTPAATPTPETINQPAPTPNPTPASTIALPANCENLARFVDDVTVEDGTEFAPNAAFNKVWRIRNEGTCPWGPGYTVRFMSGDFFGVQREIPLTEVTEPQATIDIDVPMIAPTVEGSYRGVWQLHNLSGEPFGPTMYLEIAVTPGAAAGAPAPTGDSETLFDFVANAPAAVWLTDQGTVALQQTEISENLELPGSGGMVVLGPTVLRGNAPSQGNVLLTYPDQELASITGNYVVDVPVQPGDTLVATLGFPKLSILSDDGVTFEVSFTPNDGSGQITTLLSETVQYRDSPVTVTAPLTGLEPGQTGVFTLRILAGDSVSQDWAVWIDLRLIRP